MLVLVLGGNLLLTFLGWEGVGTCSYFLISFWFGKEANASAGKKAFVTNRVGDWGFMVAMFFVFFTFGSLNYTEILPGAAGVVAQTTATVIALMLFVGAVGKSAQIPLYIWLPDAMAGPTPVSALIHAATMVTAGVYLMCRISPVLAHRDDWVPMLIAWIGVHHRAGRRHHRHRPDGHQEGARVLDGQPARLHVPGRRRRGLLGGHLPHDHPRLLQGLLFLGSGSVIHGMHDEQDMRRMGNLTKYMPVTAVTFMCGWLAIAGIPPFSGFWSKDEILAYALQANPALYAVGLFTALLTAYYMSRPVFRTFYGDEKWRVVPVPEEARPSPTRRRGADERRESPSTRCPTWSSPSIPSRPTATSTPTYNRTSRPG